MNSSIIVKQQNPVEKAIQQTYRERFEPGVDFIEKICKPVTAISKWDTKATLSIDKLDQDNIKNQGRVIENNKDRSKFYLDAIKDGELDEQQLKLIKEECAESHKRDMETVRLGQEATSNAREVQKQKSDWLVVAAISIPLILSAALHGIMAAFPSGKNNN